MKLVVAVSLANAVEVKNLRTGQEGQRAFVQFDLVGKPGEREADVTVSLEVGGEHYSSARLTLSGDLGKNVKVGVGRRIWWDLLKDMPAGYDAEIGWDLEAASTAEYIATIRSQKESAGKEKAERAKQLRYEAEQERLSREAAEKEQLAIENAENQRIAGEKAAQHGMVKDKNKKDKAPATDSSVDAQEKVHFKPLKDAVLDVRAGLMWAKLGKDASNIMSYDKATGYIGKINKLKFGGFNDWRLPSTDEAVQLYDSAKKIAVKAKTEPFKVLANNFPDLKNWNYWLMTLGPQREAGYLSALSFDIETGSINGKRKSEDLCVLPVRSASVSQEDSRSEGVEKTDFDHFNKQDGSPFAVGNLVVTDKNTSLVWLRDAGKRLRWNAISSFIDKMNNNNDAGYNDWRLPTVQELEKLVSYAKDNGWGDKEGHYIADYLNSTGFSNVKAEYAPTSGVTQQAYNFVVTAARMWSGYFDVLNINPTRSEDLFTVLLVRGTSK